MSRNARIALTSRRHDGAKPSTRRLTFSRTETSFLFFALFTIPFVVAGVWIAGSSLRSARRARATSSWTKTPANLRSCRVVEGKDSDGDTTYEVEVDYTYRFAGRDYASRQLTLRTLVVSDRDKTEATCAQLRDGPDRPRES